MKKIVRLTESDLARIVKKVINEQSSTCEDDWKKIENKLKTDVTLQKGLCNEIKRSSLFSKAVEKKEINVNNKDCLIKLANNWCTKKNGPGSIDESTLNRLVKKILKETSGGEDCWKKLTDENISVPQSCREKGNTQCIEDLQKLLDKINNNPKQREVVKNCMKCYRDKFIDVVADSPIFKK